MYRGPFCPQVAVMRLKVMMINQRTERSRLLQARDYNTRLLRSRRQGEGAVRFSRRCGSFPEPWRGWLRVYRPVSS